MSKKIVLPVVISSLSLLPFSVFGQVKLEGKLEKYHEVLLKRPQSSNLYEKFQTQFLSAYDDEALGEFLKKESEANGTAAKQVYASYLSQRGREQQAHVVLSAAISENATEQQVFIDRAKINARTLDFDGALADIGKALELAAKDDTEFRLQANKLKGRYLIRQGKADEAIVHWKTLAEENSEDQELTEDVIDILMGDGLYEAALEHAEQLRNATKDPYKKALRTLRVGDILQKNGDRDKALAVYEETLMLSGVGSWLEREIVAQVENLFRKEDNIVGLKDKLVSLKDQYDQRLKVHQKLAEVYSELGQHKESRELYFSVIKRSPNDKLLKESLLQDLERAGDYKASSHLLGSMIQLTPKDAELHVKLAEIFEKLEEKEKSLENLQLYYKKVTQNATTTIRYANLLKKHGFDAESLAIYTKAVADYSDVAEVLFSAAEYYVSTNKKGEAIPIWEKLAAFDNTEIVNRLLETLLVQGESERAIKLVNELKAKHQANRAFVSVAIKVAKAAKNRETAIDLSRTLLVLVKNTSEIDSAVKQYTSVIQEYNIVKEEIDRVSLKASSSLKDRLLLLNLLAADGQDEAADKLVLELEESDDIPSLLQVVRIFEQRYELDKSIAALEKVLKLPNGLKANYLKRICNLCDRSGDSVKALEYASRWKKLTPNDKQAWLREVELLEQTNGVKPALNALRRGMEKFEGQTDVFAKLASLYADNENYQQAKQLYWRLYDESEDLQTRLQWVSQLAHTAQRDGSVEDLIDKLVVRRRNSPQSITPIMSLAEVYRVEDRKEERRTLLLESTRLKPNDATIYLEVANADLREGKRNSAIELLQKAQQIDKTGPATQKLAKIYFDDSEFEKGLEELEKVMDSSNDPRVAEASILNLIKQDEFEEANVYLNKQISNFPEDGRLMFLSSVIDYELGHIERSIETSMKILTGSFNMDGVKSGWDLKNFTTHNRNNLLIEITSAEFQNIVLANEVSSILKRFSDRAYGSSHYYGFQSIQSVLPIDKNGLEILSKIYLIGLLEDLGAQERNLLENRLKTIGIKRLELWSRIAHPRELSLDDILLELCLENLNDSFYLKLFVDLKTQKMELQFPEAVVEQLKESKLLLSETSQKLLPFIVKEGTSLEKHQEIFMSALRNQDLVDPVIMWAFLSLKQGGSLTDQEVNLLENYIAKHPVDPSYHPSQRSSTTNHSLNEVLVSFRIQRMLTKHQLEGDDYEKIVEYLNRNIEGDTTHRVNTPYSYSSGSKHPSIENVTTSLTSIPNSYLELNDEINLAKLHSLSNKIKHPIFRYLVTLDQEPNNDHRAILEDTNLDKKYKVDALLLKAKWFYSHEKFKESLLTFEQVRKETRDAQLRGVIDFYIVEAARSYTASIKQESTDTAVLTIAQSSARRLFLRRKIVDVEKIELILSSLDMQGERNRYITKSSKSVRNKKVIGGVVGSVFSRGRTNLYFAHSRVNQQLEPWEKAKELFDNNQKESAVRLLTKTMKSYQKPSLELRYPKEESEQCVAIIKSLKLENEVLINLFPGNSTSIRKWLTYHFTAELLGAEVELNKSVTFFKNVKLIPRSVKLSVAMALIDSNSDRSLEILQSIDDAEEVFSRLIFHMQNYINLRTSLEKYYRAHTFVTTYLKSIDVKSISSFSYGRLYLAMSAMRDFEDAFYKDNEEKVVQGKNIFLENNRFIDMLSLRNSAVCEIAFKWLHADYRYNNIDLKLLEMQLVDSLAKMIKSKETVKLNLYPVFFHLENVQGITRSRFLAQRMLKSKNANIISDETLGELSSADKELADFMKFCKQYIVLPDHDLEAKINQLKFDDPVGDYIHWINLLNIRSHSKFNILLTNKILDMLLTYDYFSENEESIVHSEYEVLFSFIEGVLSKNNSNEVINRLDKLLNKLAEDCTKSTDKLSAWFDYTKTMPDFGGKDVSLLIYKNIMSFLSRSPYGNYLLIKSIQEHEYPYFIFENRVDNMVDIINPDASLADYRQEKSKVDLSRLMKDLGYLVDSDKIKITKFKKHTETDLNNYAKKYPRLQRYFNSYRPNDVPSSILEMFCSNIESMEQTIVAKFVYDLKQIKGDKKLTAQLILSQFTARGVMGFCEDNKDAIIDSPPAYKEALIAFFNLDELNTSRILFNDAGLLEHLPLEELQVDNDAFTEFFAYEAPLDRVQLQGLPAELIRLIKDNVELDLEICREAINHFVDLVKASPEASVVFADKHNQTGVGPTQTALIDHVFSGLREEKVLPVQSFPLIYSLYQREDMSELFITQVIAQSVDYDWVEDGTYHPDLKKSVGIMFNRFADFYATVEDPVERSFYKVAWYSHVRTTKNRGRLPYRFFNMRKILGRKVPGNSVAAKRKEEFGKFTRTFINMNSHEDNVNLHLFPDYWYTDYRLFHIRNIAVKGYRSYFKSVQDYPLKQRMIIANSSSKQAYHKIGEYSKEMLHFCVDVFVEAIAKDPDYMVSNDLRYIAGLHSSLEYMDEDRQAAFSDACLKCIQAATDHLNQGGYLHQNHLENLAASLNSDTESVQELAKLVDANPNLFRGMTTYAIVLLNHGHIDQAYKILHDSIVMNISENAYIRMRYTKSIEKHLPALLAKYNKPSHKATVAAIFLLPCGTMNIDGEIKSLHQRNIDVLALAKKAEANFPVNSRMNLVGNRVTWCILDKKFQKYADDYMNIVDESYLTPPRKKDVFIYQFINGETDYLDAQIEMASKALANKDQMSFKQNIHLSYLLESALGAMHLMWGSGDHDDTLRELLPRYRKLIDLKLKVGYRGNGDVPIGLRTHLAAKFIHAELGETDAWNAFLAGYGYDRIIKSNQYYTPLAVFTDTKSFDVEISNVQSNDLAGFLLRMINNPEFQKHVVSVQARGGIFDYLCDFRMLSHKQAREIIHSGKIVFHEESLKGVIESDLAHIASVSSDSESLLKHALAMKASHNSHPLENKNTMLRHQVRAAVSLSQMGHKEAAKSLVDVSLLGTIDERTALKYRTLSNQLGLKKLPKGAGKKKK